MVLHPGLDDHLCISKILHKELLSLISKKQQNGKVSLKNVVLGIDCKLSI